MSAQREVNLVEYKKELLARSEAYRQSLKVQGHELQQSLAWLPRTMGMAKSVAPLMAFGVPLAGMLLFRKKKPAPQARKTAHPPAKKGLLAMVLGGIELYNRLRPILTVFAQHRASNGSVRRTRPAEEIVTR